MKSVSVPLTMVILLFAILVNCGCMDDRRTLFCELDLDRSFSDAKVRSLVLAARTGDVETLDRLIEQGVDVNARGRGGMTPLIRLLFDGGSKEGFLKLLELGADPNVIMINGQSAMNYAAKMGDPFWIEKLLEHGGDPNLPNEGHPFQFKGRTPLLYAISEKKPENAKVLIEKGADLEHRDIYGYTPISEALGYRQYEIVFLLLTKNVNTNVPTSSENTDVIKWIKERNNEFQRNGRTEEEEKWFQAILELLESRGYDMSFPEDLRIAREKAHQEREEIRRQIEAAEDFLNKDK